MDIVEFFQLSEGKWFSQRTSHHLAFKRSESGKSNLHVEMRPKTSPEVVSLCEQHNVNPESAVCGARITQDGNMEWDKGKRTGSTLLVLIADPNRPNEGQFLQNVGHSEKAPITSRYILGNDDVLTLITEYETMSSEERLWFASPNLRLRTSTLKCSDDFSMTSFCSEIRMGGVKPQEKGEG
ncbi:MAG: phycobiliprotein lyase [Leptolyngbyaceae cyanobacterium RU_5_1]|nr:phycobiliprotein lyase [Leptolyngbyaceae cyanobacterium RU_5_1]